MGPITKLFLAGAVAGAAGLGGSAPAHAGLRPEAIIEMLDGSGMPSPGRSIRRRGAFQVIDGFPADWEIARSHKGGRMGGGKKTKSTREQQERQGLFNTGVRPAYPEEARCLEVKSFFGDQTRYDGSRRAYSSNYGYHVGFDISADIGTPLVAIADGEVINKHTGGMLVGNQIYLRHAPEDTGLPVWIYSKYKHFRELPDLDVGERVKMGQVVGFSGDSGTAGGHFPTGYPHLHMSIYVARSGKYKPKRGGVRIKDSQYLDPFALYLVKERNVLDNHAIRALAEAEKTVAIPYKSTDGRIVPSDARLIWPFMCEPK